jgi:hypothetical protein
MRQSLCESCYCFEIQLDIFSSATGDMVSSMPAYSAGQPVFAVWNRWFRPGSSSTSKCLLPACPGPGGLAADSVGQDLFVFLALPVAGDVLCLSQSGCGYERGENQNAVHCLSPLRG